jgi:hypothetical protein
MRTYGTSPNAGMPCRDCFQPRARISRRIMIAAVWLLVAVPAVALAANIASEGTGILGFQSAVDSSPGSLLFHAGTPADINDADLLTHVDNFSGGSDAGQGISFVGVLWPSLRYEEVASVVLTLAAFGDGGWFGPNGRGPGYGGRLSYTYMTMPTVQVSTNRGLTWITVSATSDYFTALNGQLIGGPLANPASLSSTFSFSPPLTNISGLRIIGPNGGTADGNGFLGVFEMDIEATFPDADGDGMPDAWELAHGLVVGVFDASDDPDGDGLTNIQEYQENTDPHNSDCDGDGYSDGVEFVNGTDPNDPNSIPGNLAKEGSGILGTESAAGVDMEVFNSGLRTYINDGNLNSHVDTWNGASADPLSYVGILWLEAPTNPVLRLELTLATFGDGGWFGPNNRSPAPGGLLDPTYLTEPEVQVTTDPFGMTWADVAHTSDYLTALNGHGIGGGLYPNPNMVTATFILDTPASGIFGVRIIGSEGGVASGGFLGVGELKVYAKTDADADGMDDDWERKHGLVVGVNDAALDPDGDGLSNLQEFQRATDPKNPDTDGDGLKDGPEVNTYHTNPLSADTDQDGLSDGAEVNTYGTDPLVADTDGDNFPDGLEVRLGSDPLSAASIPSNLAFRADAKPILGTEDVWGGTDTPVANAGVVGNINDGDLTTRVDTWNGDSLDTLSFLGIVWTNTMTNEVVGMQLSLATFFDGGWFGTNGVGPGSGGVLNTNDYLAEPVVQVSSDGGVTWNNAAVSSDYLIALDGHPLPAIDFDPPTLATAHFWLTPPQTGINAIRIIGAEGGTATGGFLGVFELAVLARFPQPVLLLNPQVGSGQFRFEFDTQAGSSYEVQFKTALPDATWQTLTFVAGNGTRRPVTDAVGGSQRFYRVLSQ